MLIYPDIDPVAFRAFGFPVRWYGLMYLFALGLAIAYGRRALARKPIFADAGGVQIVDFVTAAALGVIIGGRLGYAVFYKLGDYAESPLSVFYLWQGGMSFHGGLLGAIVAVAVYARRVDAPFLRLTDLAVLLAPPGLGLGRLGNFIGGELPGRVASADLPWAMIYRHIDDMPRHPSQLYQALLEGVVLAVLMIVLSRRYRPAGWLSAMFLLSYGVLRFISEFFREPDAHLGLQLFDLSRGQWLCLPMVVAGVVILSLLPGKKKRQKAGKDKTRMFLSVIIKGIKRIIFLPAAVFAKISAKGANKQTDISADVNSATTITPAAEAATATKPSFAFFAFVFAIGGYVCHLPVRFWLYMRNDEPDVARVVMMEAYAAANNKPKADNNKGALWNFFFDDNEPAAVAEVEDDHWQMREQRKARKRIVKEADWEDDTAADDDGYDDDNDGGGTRASKRGGGFFNFFFADDDGDGDDDGKTMRQSRRDKRRMKKKKRR